MIVLYSDLIFCILQYSITIPSMMEIDNELYPPFGGKQEPSQCFSIRQSNQTNYKSMTEKPRKYQFDVNVQRPIVSKSKINERMFRSKPYTKCIECLNDQSKLRCAKCIESIINDISKRDQPKRVFRIKHKQAFGMSDKNRPTLHQSNHTYTSRKKLDQNQPMMSTMYPKKNDVEEMSCKIVESCENTRQNTYNVQGNSKTKAKETVLIASKYSWWLNQKIKKRQNLTHNYYSTSSYWPRKRKKDLDYNLERLGAKQPKFEKWERKVLDQLLSKTNKLR